MDKEIMTQGEVNIHVMGACVGSALGLMPAIDKKQLITLIMLRFKTTQYDETRVMVEKALEGVDKSLLPLNKR